MLRSVGSLLLVFVVAVIAQTLTRPDEVIALEGDTGHVQGIVVDRGRVWVSSVHKNEKRGTLAEFALPQGKRIRMVEVHDGDAYHPGGMSAHGDSLWIPVAEYRRASTAIIQKRNRQTLAIESSFNVPDHIGCVAATDTEIIGGNWDSKLLHVWDHSGKLLRKAPNPTNNAFQDLKIADGQLVGSGLLPDKSGAIDWLEYPSLRPVRRLLVGRTDRGVAYSHEGMAIAGDTLWLLPEDAPSRLFRFRIPPIQR